MKTSRVRVTLCALAVGALAVPAAGTDSAPPTQRWEQVVEAGGTRGGPVAAGVTRNLVVVGGTAGGDQRGDNTDGLIQALRTNSGTPTWSRSYDSGRTDEIAELLTTEHDVYVAGSASELVVGSFHSASFLLALRARDGEIRWQTRSSMEDGAPVESLYGAAVAGDRLVVVGSVDGEILVRAYRARTGRLLWEHAGPLGEAIDERAARVLLAGDRVYVAGTRHTVGGRSVPYVVRAYDAASGQLLWDSQFSGGGLSTVRGLALLDDTVVVAGQYYDIGPGITHMDLHGLSAGSGEHLWMRLPAGRGFDSYSFTSALTRVDGNVVVGGNVSRARTLPVVAAYDAAGARAWKADVRVLKFGSVQALASFGGNVVAAGQAQTLAAVETRGPWLVGYDPASGAGDWEMIGPPGTVGSGGLVLASAGDALVVVAAADSATGQQWIVRSYGGS